MPATITKTAARYQYQPRGTEQCGRCSMYRDDRPEAGGGSCTLVLGEIVPQGWCQYFARASRPEPRLARALERRVEAGASKARR